MKQLAFLIISSSPSLKNVAQNFKPLVLAKTPYFSWVMVFLPYIYKLKLPLSMTSLSQPQEACHFEDPQTHANPPLQALQLASLLS